MKRLLLLVFCLLGSALAGATTYTAVAGGDWNSPSTWSPSGIPHMSTCATCNAGSPDGDIVVIPDNILVTCIQANEICSIGNSPAAHANVLTTTHLSSGGGLRIGGTAIFIYAGDIAFTYGSFRADPGARIQYDSSWSSASTTVRYYFAVQGAQFNILGTPANHVTWEGDSFADPSGLKNAAACTAAGTCLAGAIGYTGTFPTDMASGTLNYIDIRNVFGTPYSSGSIALGIAVGTQSSFSTGLTVTNSGLVTLNVSYNSTASVNWSGFYNLGCTNTQAGQGCFMLTNVSPSFGTYSISNSIFDGPSFMAYNIPTATNWTYRNVMFVTSQQGYFYTNAAANGGTWPGPTSAVDSGIWDQIFLYNTCPTTSATDAACRMTISPRITNSVIWGERTNANGGPTHSHSFQEKYDASVGGTINQTHNYWGSMGSVGTGTLTANATGNTPSLPLVHNVTGNVTGCGYNGQGTNEFGATFFSLGISKNYAQYASGNVSCSTNIQGMSGGNNPVGSAGAESAAFAAGISQSVDSNLFFNMSGGYPIAELCDSANANYVATKPFALFTNNAVYNTNTGGTPICANNVGWITSGPQNDVIVQNRPPALVEGGRSLPLFDVEYLGPAGLLPGGRTASAYYASQAQWKGAWSASSTYSVGDYVSDAQTGVFSGITTYWRCVQSHTAAAINRPVTGVNPAQIYYGHEAYWEEAFLPWFRTQVLAGTTFSDGAIEASNLGVIGLLNTWLWHGFISLEPALWTCGAGRKDCGLQRSAIQHIAPPPAVN